MSYLDRLRETEKIQERPAPPTDKTDKTPIKGNFDGFVGTPPGPFEKISPPETDRPSWRWLVQHTDGSWIDHTVTPHATLAEMRAAYPDAVSFEPLFGLTPAMEQPRDAA